MPAAYRPDFEITNNPRGPSFEDAQPVAWSKERYKGEARKN
jgi:hypothetical protein